MDANTTLTKAVLVDQLHDRIGITKKEAGEYVDAVFHIIKTTLVHGEKVKISGFGNFLVRDKSARRGRNPQTSEEIVISRRRVITFKPSQVLRASLNEGGD